MGKRVISSKIRDPRFITVRRGGTLQDADHYLLAIWAADCAQNVSLHSAILQNQPQLKNEFCKIKAKLFSIVYANLQ